MIRFHIYLLFWLIYAVTSANNEVKYVFYFIGDGMGASQRQLAELYSIKQLDKKESLRMNRLEVTGLYSTYSVNSLITDSAASGTALATGYKTNNRMIGKLPNGKKIKNLIEAAQEKKLATGIITTTRITDATPASFSAHVYDRKMEDEIAGQQLESGINFLAGGGIGHFLPKNSGKAWYGRKDGRNLLNEFRNKGYIVVTSLEEVEKNKKDLVEKNSLILLSPSHLPYEINGLNNEKVITLDSLVELGISNLSRFYNGFVLIVEGGRIDHACHAHDAKSAIYEILAFDRAIEKAYEFYEKYPQETLIVVGADHETGGLGLGISSNYNIGLKSLKGIDASVDKKLRYRYRGDRDEFFKLIGKYFSLESLAEEERKSIEKSMDLVDMTPADEWGSKYYDKNKYGDGDPVEVAVTNIISKGVAVIFMAFCKK